MPKSVRRAKRKSGGSGGGSWLWLVALLVLGGAVFVARTSEGDPSQKAPAPTSASRAEPPTRVEVAAARATAAPSPRPTAVQRPATASATPRPARAAATATPAATRAPTSRPTPAEATPKATGVPSAAPTTPSAKEASGDRGSVALTFDAGADRGYAEDILDVLAEQHVVGSFGITGKWARANPDLVRRMAAEGHLVFNHTLDHRSFTGVSDSLGGLSAAQRRAELDQADAIIAPLIGHSTKPFYRLPYGDDDAHEAADVALDGYTRKIGWTVDSLGWRGVQSSDILARCLKLAAPGAIYILHVGRASQDAIALPQIVAGLRERGFHFARVDSL